MNHCVPPKRKPLFFAGWNIHRMTKLNLNSQPIDIVRGIAAAQRGVSGYEKSGSSASHRREWGLNSRSALRPDKSVRRTHAESPARTALDRTRAVDEGDSQH